MFTRALKYKNILNPISEKHTGTTLINMNPGVFETKLIIAGWPLLGKDVEEATDTFKLAILEKYANPNGDPVYYNELVESKPLIKPANDPIECEKLYDHLCKLIEKRSKIQISVEYVDE